MNKEKLKLILFFLIGLLTAFLAMYLINNYNTQQKAETANNSEIIINSGKAKEDKNLQVPNSSVNIDELTNESTVINFVKTHHQLPPYYIKKSHAKKQGWIASKGNLCDVLPGKAIGGDHFSNREKTLPAGNKYFEADVNYNCGNRNADRIVFTRNGEVWLTKNHYKSFEKQ